jgi:hypothetical protein
MMKSEMFTSQLSKENDETSLIDIIHRYQEGVFLDELSGHQGE